jgi:diguanylate cyclase (GGDEF)-like protein
MIDGGPPRICRTAIAADALDLVMPMHVHVSDTGHIAGCGPTLKKVAGNEVLTGRDFFDLFQVRCPADVTSLSGLVACPGQRLYLSLRGRVGAEFRGIAVPDAGAGVLLNLSFGIGLVEAVRAHALTDADFAPTDLAVEMLYVVEAKHAVLDEFKRLNRRLEGARSQAEEQALTDTLTGLRNRRALDIALTAACAAPKDFALMHIDLDHFKAVNDTLGHAAGDAVLREVALVLRAETRLGDTVARVGGDEFVILLPQMTDTVVLVQVADRIIARLAQPMQFQDAQCRIGASVGLTISTGYKMRDADRMIADADQALYAAKRAGRAQTRVFRHMA